MALTYYPARFVFSTPREQHPSIFTADCLHAMSLLAYSRGVHFDLEDMTRDHFPPKG